MRLRFVLGPLSLLLVGAAAATFLSACDGDSTRDPSQYPISRTELERNAPSEDPAELSYRRYCIGCHGSDGHGNGGSTGADLAATDGPLVKRTDAELISSVRNGKSGKNAVMPAHSPVLDDMQIAAVVGYVKKRFGPAQAVERPAAEPSAEQHVVDHAREAKPVAKPEGAPTQAPTPAPAP